LGTVPESPEESLESPREAAPRVESLAEEEFLVKELPEKARFYMKTLKTNY
jgi:hypothetical protein